jgi:hypothetical protein
MPNQAYPTSWRGYLSYKSAVKNELFIPHRFTILSYSIGEESVGQNHMQNKTPIFDFSEW